MINFKKTTIAAFIMASGSVFAGTMGPVCVPGSVTVPCEVSGWDLGVYALYLEPSYSGHPTSFNYAGNSIVNSQRVHTELRTDFDWGFKLEGSYHFSTGNDVNVNWYHWKDTTSQNFHYFGETNGDEVFFNNLQIEHKWDAVNLEFGQHVDFGEFKNIRFHGGAQFARIENNLNRPYVINFAQSYAIDQATGLIALTPAGTEVGTDRNIFTFKGVGPRVGTDMSYDWINGFAIYANGAAALLIGDTEINDTSDVEPNRASHTAIVPELEAKLGLKYTYAMEQGNLTLDGGYMVVNYWDAFHVVQSGLAGSSNFGVHGPFLGLKYLSM